MFNSVWCRTQAILSRETQMHRERKNEKNAGTWWDGSIYHGWAVILNEKTSSNGFFSFFFPILLPCISENNELTSALSYLLLYEKSNAVFICTFILPFDNTRLVIRMVLLRNTLLVIRLKFKPRFAKTPDGGRERKRDSTTLRTEPSPKTKTTTS